MHFTISQSTGGVCHLANLRRQSRGSLREYLLAGPLLILYLLPGSIDLHEIYGPWPPQFRIVCYRIKPMSRSASR